LSQDVKDISRKTLDDTLKKCLHLQKIVKCMVKHDQVSECFQVVKLDNLLEMLKSLDTTEVRAAKMLDAKDLDKLHFFKQSLVIIAISFLSKENLDTSDSAFFNYVLNESKVIRPVLKKKVL